MLQSLLLGILLLYPLVHLENVKNLALYLLPFCFNDQMRLGVFVTVANAFVTEKHMCPDFIELRPARCRSVSRCTCRCAFGTVKTRAAVASLSRKKHLSQDATFLG
jgi:hypothetical protein